MIKKTVLYEKHIENNAKMVEYANYYLPISYQSTIKECLAVRNDSGIFDCSHMGIFSFNGKDSTNFLDFLVSANIKTLPLNKAIYTAILYENGTFVDDIIIYHIKEKQYLMVVNASNKEKNRLWIEKQKVNFDVTLQDWSESFSLLAIQGKKSPQYINKVFNDIYSQIPAFGIVSLNYENHTLYICKTGYTGEQGIEILCPNEIAINIFDTFVNKGVTPCGLAARDILRLEKGYSLYGNEINEKTNLIEAGLSWICDFSKEKFIGKETLERIKNNPELKKQKIIGFICDEKPIPRKDDIIINSNNQKIGYVTSGAFSPILKKGIGLAYISKDYDKKTCLIKTKRKILSVKITKRNIL